MFTVVAVNQGNVIQTPPFKVQVPIYAQVVMGKRELTQPIQGELIPKKEVIKVSFAFTKIRKVSYQVIKDKAIIKGVALQHYNFVDIDNVTFFQQVCDNFTIASPLPGALPGMELELQFTTKEHIKVISPTLVKYWNVLSLVINLLQTKVLKVFVPKNVK